MKSKKKVQITTDGTVFGKEKSHKIFYWALLLIPLAHFCVFYIGVNFNSILLAFKSYTMKDGVWNYKYSVANFKRVFEYFGVGRMANFLAVFPPILPNVTDASASQ